MIDWLSTFTPHQNYLKVIDKDDAQRTMAAVGHRGDQVTEQLP